MVLVVVATLVLTVVPCLLMATAVEVVRAMPRPGRRR